MPRIAFAPPKTSDSSFDGPHLVIVLCFQRIFVVVPQQTSKVLRFGNMATNIEISKQDAEHRDRLVADLKIRDLIDLANRRQQVLLQEIYGQ